MKNWVFILILFPISAMAGESGVGNFLSKLFPSTAERVSNTVEDVTSPGSGVRLSNTITNRLAPTYPQQGAQQMNPATAYPYQAQQPAQTPAQPAAPAAANDQATRDSLVRCMYMGKLIETNTAQSEDSAEAQVKAERVGQLYKSLNCNDLLKNYGQVIKGVDEATNQCLENEDCQTISLPTANASGGVKK